MVRYGDGRGENGDVMVRYGDGGEGNGDVMVLGV